MSNEKEHLNVAQQPVLNTGARIEELLPAREIAAIDLWAETCKPEVDQADMASPYAAAPAGTGADYGLEMLPTAEQLDKAFEQLKQAQEEGAPFPAIDSLGGYTPPEGHKFVSDMPRVEVTETEFEKSFKHHPMSDWRANITHDEIDAKDISPEAKEMMHAALRQFENQVVAKGDYDGNVMWTRQKHNSFKNRGMGVTRAPASKRKLKKKKK